MNPAEHPARRHLGYRSRALIDAIIDTIDDHGNIEHARLIDALIDTADPRTIGNTLGELAAFGAIQRTGHVTGRGRHASDTRHYRLTYLGQCWLTNTTPDDHEHMKDPTP